MDCSCLLIHLDNVLIGIHKFYKIIKYSVEINEEQTTVEVTEIASLVTIFIENLNEFFKVKLPDGNELRSIYKTIEQFSSKGRSLVLQLITETKKVILQISSSNINLLRNCKDIIDCFMKILLNIWKIAFQNVEKSSWPFEASRDIFYDISALNLIANEMGNKDELSEFYIKTCCDIKTSISTLQSEDNYIDKFPISIQALFTECINSLSIITDNNTENSINNFDSIFEDISTILVIMKEKLTLESLLDDIDEEYSEDDENNENNENNIKIEISDNSDNKDTNNLKIPIIDIKNDNKTSGNNTIPIMEQIGRQRSGNVCYRPQLNLSNPLPHNNQDHSLYRSNTTIESNSPPISPLNLTRKQTFTFRTPNNGSNTERAKISTFGVQRHIYEIERKKKAKETAKANQIADLFKSKFPKFKEMWDSSDNSDEDKSLFLTSLYKKMIEISFPENLLHLPNSQSKSQELSHIIRLRSAADLSRVFSMGSLTQTVKVIADNSLKVIVHSSLVVIDPNIQDYEDILLHSSGELGESLIESLSLIPMLNQTITDFRENLKSLLNDHISSITDIFTPDSNIIRAAKGIGSKSIAYQMKINIWHSCNSLRILISILLNLLTICLNSSYVSSSTVFQIFTCIRCIVPSISKLLGQVATTKHITTKEHSSIHIPRSDTMNYTQRNIWMECTSSGIPIWKAEEANSDSKVKIGSFNLLVQTLTSDINLNQTFLKTFITTYRSFTTPWQLLSKLIERYNVPEGIFILLKRPRQIKLRVAVVVKYWLDTQFYDFDEDLIQALQEFCTTMHKDGLTEMANRLKELITSKELERKTRQESFISIPPTDLTWFSSLSSLSSLISNCTVEELCCQLTLADYKIYKDIQPQEFLNTAWNSDKLKHRSPHITLLLGRLNDISNFICSLILWQESKKERAQLITKFIQLGIQLHNINNFHTLMGVVVALNRSSISRLRYTFAECDSKLLQKFKSLESLMDPSGAFKNYRKAIQTTKLPALPYLGVALTDLTFIEDGNPDNIADPSTDNLCINYTKREMVYELVQKLLDYQNTPYNFPEFEPLQTIFTEFPYETEKQQFALSLLREPRNADPKTIL